MNVQSNLTLKHVNPPRHSNAGQKIWLHYRPTLNFTFSLLLKAMQLHSCFVFFVFIALKSQLCLTFSYIYDTTHAPQGRGIPCSFVKFRLVHTNGKLCEQNSSVLDETSPITGRLYYENRMRFMEDETFYDFIRCRN